MPYYEQEFTLEEPPEKWREVYAREIANKIWEILSDKKIRKSVVSFSIFEDVSMLNWNSLYSFLRRNFGARVKLGLYSPIENQTFLKNRVISAENCFYLRKSLQ